MGPKKSRRWFILAALPVFLIAAYSAAGFFLAPALLTRYLSNSLQQAADIGLTAGEAHFNPFTMRLQLDDVSTIATTDVNQPPTPETTLLHIDHVLINLHLIALLHNSLACNSLEIKGLTASVIRYPDKSYNLPALASENTTENNSKAETDSLSRLPLLFSLNNITITDSRIFFDDRLNGKKHSVEQIKLDLPTLSNFSFEAGEYIRPHFSAIINGSPVELTGEAALPGEKGQNGLKTNLACTLQNLDLPLYFAYLPKSMPLVLDKGKGEGKIQISFTPKDKKGGRLTVGFQLTTTGIELANTEHSLAMTAPSMQIEGSLQPLDGALHLHNLHILQPQFSADQGHFSQDMAQLFSGPATSKDAPEQPQHHLDIDSLTVENGALQLTDKEQKGALPPWTTIQIQVKNFSTASEQGRDKGTFTLSSKQEKTNAALSWQGSFNDRGIPGGALQLGNIQAGTLLSFVDPVQAKNATGAASLHGHFSFDPTTKHSGMITLIDATTEVHDLTLLDQKQTWLAAKKVQITGTKFKEGNLDLGTIALTESVLILHQDKLPPFLQSFGADKKPILIQGIDFSGKATLHPQKEKMPALELSELHMKTGSLTAKGASQNNFEFAARINQTGMLKAQGLVSLFPVRASLSLALAAISSEQVAPWLPDAPLFQQGRASVHGQGTYRYPESSFTGTLQLSEALIRDDEKSPGLAASKIELNDVTIKTNPLRIGMKELILDAPKLTWKLETDGPGPVAQIASFLRNLLSQPQNRKNQQQNAGDSVLSGIQRISFDNATISHEDLRLDPPWSALISQVKGQITNPHEKSDAGASLELSGLLDTVPFTLSGSGDFLTGKGNSTTKLNLNGFPLLPLAAQITPLLDINPKAGSFNLSCSHTLQNGEEQGEAAFLFSGLNPGSAKSETALPLALLADSQDQMKLLVPLAKDSTQPLLKQTIATFQALMVKAKEAPLLPAGAEFTDLHDKQSIPFPAGQSTFDVNRSSNGQETLRRFKALLAAHPHLGLTLTGMADPIHDRAALLKTLEEKERKRVALKNEQQLQAWQKKQKEKEKQQAPPQIPLPGKIIEQDIPIQEARPALLKPEPVTVSDTTLYDLAQERALQVYDFCTTDLGITSERISLQEKSQLSTPETAGNLVKIGLRPLF
ncbi:MAG: DUF748 domain-containing protein [Deltaproteobacteria bacterium]|nr:DUF748 domain-containing protein [Deltaproteobacteria bacterium]